MMKYIKILIQYIEIQEVIVSMMSSILDRFSTKKCFKFTQIENFMKSCCNDALRWRMPS